jgi:secreted trypsin-like serine protease
MLLRRKLPVLWATLVGALVAAMVVAFFVFVQSGKAAPQAADKQPSASESPKIVGGTEVSDGKYPFMALLDFRTPKGQFLGSCGASLIDQDSVLTAAHCLAWLPSNSSKYKLRVIVGRTVRSSTQGQVRDWKTWYIHPGYNPKKNDAYDAAVINLGRAVSGITPINLATSTQNNLESPGRKATVAGWGNTFANPPDPPGPPNYPDRMHEAQVPIYSDASGQQTYRQDYLPPLMIAAAGKTEVDTCQGDSGGPLFAQVSGKYTQIGITSVGLGCAAGKPGIYTEVNNPSIRDFITKAAAK